MKVTRREFAAIVAPTAAAVAQNATPASPADELRAAQSRLKTAADALARQQVPMDAEPAFQFKA